MPLTITMPVAAVIRAAARPVTGSAHDYDSLLGLIGDAQVVLLGEASHGTHEFYRERARITQRLIEEEGFVANNQSQPEGRKVGFYGLDLYSLFASMQEVIRFLEKVDPDAAVRARYRYSCLDAFGEDTQAYGYAAEFGVTRSCEDQAVQQLVELQRHAELAQRDGGIPEDELFYAEQNARLVKNAEQYYRTMFRGRVESWNLRDRHMAETLEALIAHLGRRGGRARVVVWEHNSHIGDARATRHRRLRLGRSRRAEKGPAGVAESFEALFHTVGTADFVLPLRDDMRLHEALSDRRLERAIGVIYRPDSERVSHYFEARLPQQFDAVIHFDETRAVEPLDRTPGWDKGEPPETFPFGL